MSKLGSIAEQVDEEVAVGPVAAGMGFTGVNNISGHTEVSGGLATESEQQDSVPGGTASRNFGDTGGVQPEKAAANPSPRVAADIEAKRDRSQSRDSSCANSDGIAQALSVGLSQELKQVGEHFKRDGPR